MDNQENILRDSETEKPSEDVPKKKMLNLGASKVLPLNFDTQEMRFLVLAPHHGDINSELACSLSYEALQECQPYTAVINTRGNPINHTAILVDGEEIPASQNIRTFLFHVRAEDHSLRLWFRDLCLDATNPEEKSRYWNPGWVAKMNEYAEKIIDLSEIMATLWDEGKLPRPFIPRDKYWDELRDLKEWKNTPLHHPASLAAQQPLDAPPLPHEYLPLDYVMDEFRLFELWQSGDPLAPLQAALAYTPMHSNMPYTCLSYTWGEEEATHEILMNGQKFWIRKNLDSFLRTIRREGAKFVMWIDAICINQESISERSRQLQRMLEIYSTADTVVSWVGESDEASEMALDLIPDIQSPVLRQNDDSSWDVKDSENFPRRLAALYRFLLRPYFRRIWVIQELAVSSSPTLACGKRYIPWRQLDMGAYHLIDILHRDISMPAKMKSADPFLESIDDRAISFVRRLFYFRHLQGRGSNGNLLMGSDPQWLKMGDQTPGILDIIILGRDFESTSLYDKIFALWNLARDTHGMNFKMDYSNSLSQTYIDFAVAEAEHKGCLDIICATEPTRNEELDVPSWVPDWSTPSTASSMIRREHIPNIFMSVVKNIGGPIYQAAGKGVITPRFTFSGKVLECTGLIIDKVKIVACFEEPLKRELFKEWMDIAFAETNPFQFGNPPEGKKFISAFWSMLAGDVTGVWGIDEDEEEVNENEAETKLEGAMVSKKETESTINTESKVKDQPSSNEKAGRTSFSITCLREEECKHKLKNISSDVARLVTRGRRLIITQNGYMGLAPYWVEEGQDLAILSNCSTPVILNENIDGTYRFIGSCFVQGLMEGEFIELGNFDCSDEEFWAGVEMGGRLKIV